MRYRGRARRRGAAWGRGCRRRLSRRGGETCNGAAAPRGPSARAGRPSAGGDRRTQAQACGGVGGRRGGPEGRRRTRVGAPSGRGRGEGLAGPDGAPLPVASTLTPALSHQRHTGAHTSRALRLRRHQTGVRPRPHEQGFGHTPGVCGRGAWASCALSAAADLRHGAGAGLSDNSGSLTAKRGPGRRALLKRSRASAAACGGARWAAARSAKGSAAAYGRAAARPGLWAARRGGGGGGRCVSTPGPRSGRAGGLGGLCLSDRRPLGSAGSRPAVPADPAARPHPPSGGITTLLLVAVQNHAPAATSAASWPGAQPTRPRNRRKSEGLARPLRTMLAAAGRPPK
jgi:hypothetical protein